MHVPATILTLTLFIAIFVWLRISWPRFSYRFRRHLVLFAIAFIAMMAIAFVFNISTTSGRLNTTVYWCAVLSYIFFILLFTRIRPIWLTSVIAAVLILPLLSASAILPLAAIFSAELHNIKPVGDNLISDLVPIDAVTAGATGADLLVYSRVSWAPFLRRREWVVRYLNTQCDTSSAHAILQPDHIHMLMVCPAQPGHPPQDSRSFMVRLPHR